MLALAGCTLIDQTTFEGGRRINPLPAQVAVTTDLDQRVPIVKITYETDDPQYEEPLLDAVTAAEAKSPNQEYDVVAMVPQKPNPLEQQAAVDQGRENAAEIMRALLADSIQTGRIRLAARIDPQVTVREVRVYVR